MSDVILVADDDASGRLLVRLALEQSGFEVVEAATGVEAIAAFAEHRPQLILMDVVMPDMDGFQACSAIRLLPAGSTVPILMLTGLDDIDSIRRAFDAGATDFVTKPMNWVILSQRVLYMLRASKAMVELRESEARLENAQRIARLGYWQETPDASEIRWSKEMYGIFGVDSHAFEPKIPRFLELIHPNDREDLLRAREEVLAGLGERDLDLRVLPPDGEVRFVHLQMHLAHGSGGAVNCLTGTAQDISERKRAEEQIRFFAYFDGLTQLPNRTLFNERLKVMLPTVRRQKYSLAVLFLDLDRFKAINDTLGHTAGDLLLKEVSVRFRHCVRSSDTVARPLEAEQEENVARLGGDEFIVSVPELRRGEDAARVARRILSALETPIVLNGHEVVLSASIGIALYPDDGEEVETLLKNADVAMYKAKGAGGNRYEFYERTMTKIAFQRMSLEATLRKALDRKELVLHYQPQVNVKEGRLVGVEALIRWRHPDRGLVLPGEFIPLAEEIGLIVPIGEWVLREACAQAAAWRRAGFEMTMAVNLSAHQLRQDDIVTLLEEAIETAGYDPRGLDVEITESALVSGSEETVNKLRLIREMGVGIALDDFGTGYSPLSYLKSFPISQIKIDRMFVKEIATDLQDAAITSAIISLAHGLDVEVVAEGVETAQQLATLERQGCRLMQGYLFGRPLAVEEMGRLLGERQRDGWMAASRR